MTSKGAPRSNWLSKFITNERGNIVDLGRVPRHYYIEAGKDLENFYRRLGIHIKEYKEKFIASKRKPSEEKCHSFAEAIIPNSNIAVIGKLTIEHPEKPELLFPHVFVTKCVRAFQDALYDIYDIDISNLIAAVIKATSATESQLIIQFPLFSVRVEEHERLIYPKWKKYMQEMNVISEFQDFQPKNDIMNIQPPKDYWWLLGAYDPNKKYSYNLDTFYRYIEDDEIEDKDPSEATFEEIFDPDSQCQYVSKTIFKRGFHLNVKKDSRTPLNTANNSARSSASFPPMETDDLSIDSEIWLPFFLSPYYPIAAPPKKVQEAPKTREYLGTSITNGSDIIKDNLYDLCRMLPPHIRCEAPYVNKIGQAYYKAYNGGADGFAIWKHLTKRTNLDEENDEEDIFIDSQSLKIGEDNFFPYDTGETIEDLDAMFELREDDVPGFHAGSNMSDDEKLWDSFRMTDINNYSFNTIRYLASVYARNDFDRWLFQNSSHEFIMASELLEKRVADLFYAYFPTDFIWTGASWYYFKNHRWNDDSKEGIILAKRLTENTGGFISKIRQHKHIFERNIEDEPDPARKLQMRSVCDNIDNLCKKLHTTTFITKVVTMLKMMYFRQDFERIKDENPYILVFTNCVIEFVDENAISRIGLPEDHCTLSTNIQYKNVVPEDHEKFIRIYFNQVYPDMELRNWMWLYFVSGLVGGNPDKVITMHWGSGNNSKTQMIKILEHAFGDYFITANNTEILANVRQNRSGPEPEKIRRKGRRWNVYNELSPSQPIDVGTFKNLSGDDSQGGARDLFGGSKTMFNIRLQAKTMLVFNEDPPFSSGASDDALWDRVAKIVYMSKWVKNAPDDVKKQWEANRFLLDRQFSSYLRTYSESFMSLLIRSYKKYFKCKLPPCRLITEATASYRRTADICQLYVEERIQFHMTSDNLPDKRFKKSSSQLYADYQAWYARNYPGGSVKSGILTRPAFEAEMSRKDLQFEGSNYIGISIKIQTKRQEDSEKEDMSDDE